jgi:hypothetical protein
MTELVSTVRGRLCRGCASEMLIRLKDPTKTVTGTYFLRAVLVSEIALPGGLWKYTLEYDENLLVDPDAPIRACDYDLCCLDCQGQFFDEKLKALESGILLVDQEEDPIETPEHGILFSRAGRPRWMDSTGRVHFERTALPVEDVPDLYSNDVPGVVFSGAKVKRGQLMFQGDHVEFWYAYEDWIPDTNLPEINFDLPIVPAGEGDFPMDATLFLSDYVPTMCTRYGGNNRLRTYDASVIPATTSVWIWIHGSYAW